MKYAGIFKIAKDGTKKGLTEIIDTVELYKLKTNGKYIDPYGNEYIRTNEVKNSCFIAYKKKETK